MFAHSKSRAATAACGLMVLAAPAVASAAPPAPLAQIEQVNRASGAAGTFSLQPFQVGEVPGAITDDGRFAYFTVTGPRDQGNAASASAIVPGPGVYVRDLVLDRTVRIAGPGATFAGMDDTGHVTGFVTDQPLDPADHNTAPDLYGYERTTGTTVLLSRADGRRGAAVGVTGGATIDRGSLTALFSNAGGVYRRNVLLGTTTRVGSGPFIDERGVGDSGTGVDFTFAGIPSVDQFASADGRTYVTPTSVVTPTRTVSTGVDGQPPAVRPTISRSGDVAVWQEGPTSLATVKVANLATGQVTSPTVPAALLNTGGPLEGLDGQVLRITPDGKSVLVNTIKLNATQDDIVYSTQKWTLATGAVTPLSLVPSYISANERFALSTGGGGGNTPVITAIAAAGQTLPGQLDPPSPHGYVALADHCAGPTRSVTLAADYTHGLPTPASIRFRVWDASGALVTDVTQDPFPTGFSVSDLLEPNVGTGSYRTQVDVKLADGRTTSEGSTQAARSCAAS